LKTKKALISLLFVLINSILFAQTAKITGVILDEKNNPVGGVLISDNTTSTKSTKEGFYVIDVPVNKKVVLIFSHPAFKKITASFELKQYEIIEFNPVISSTFEQIDDVIITNSKRRVQGITSIEP